MKTTAAFAFLPCLACAQTITDPFPERIAKSDVRVELQPVASGLVSPVLAVPEPGGQRVFIVDQAGLIRVLENDVLATEPWLDVTARLVKLQPEFDERGLLGLAFDPDYTKAGAPGHRRFFTYTSEAAEPRTDFPLRHGGQPPNHQSVIASWRVAADGRAIPDSRKEVLRLDQPQFNHNGGMIAFGPDRLLYIGLGDGGGGNDLGPGHHPETGNGQDLHVPLGKMLRIDVNGTDSANGAYGIPKDNPFAAGGGLREIYAWGLRNPWRFSFDGDTLLAADVGQNQVEMVHRVVRGGNHGWRKKEGRFKFNVNGTLESAGPELTAGFIAPVLEYDHEDGTSITGGYVYRGKALPALTGRYIFADYRAKDTPTSGRLFVGDLEKQTIQELRIGQNDRPVGFLIKGFGPGPDGELYVCGSGIQGPSKTTGLVVKMVPVK
jgi:glucose/arabinose dehydrogenase